MIWEDGGYRCNDTSSQACIDNTRYNTDLWTTWEICRNIKHCSKITKSKNGTSYYYQLWKENDIKTNKPEYSFVDFDSKCRTKGMICDQKYIESKNHFQTERPISSYSFIL